MYTVIFLYFSRFFVFNISTAIRCILFIFNLYRIVIKMMAHTLFFCPGVLFCLNILKSQICNSINVSGYLLLRFICLNFHDYNLILFLGTLNMSIGWTLLLEVKHNRKVRLGTLKKFTWSLKLWGYSKVTSRFHLKL